MGWPQGVVQVGLFVVPKERIDRVVLGQVEIGDVAEQCRGRGLAVAINQGRSVPMNGEVLGEVHSHRRFADTAFEILDCDYRARVTRRAPRARPEYAAHVIELAQAVADAAIGFGSRGRGEAPVFLGVSDRGGGPIDKFRGLPNRERRLAAFARSGGPSTVPQVGEDGRGAPGELAHDYSLRIGETESLAQLSQIGVELTGVVKQHLLSQDLDRVRRDYGKHQAQLKKINGQPVTT